MREKEEEPYKRDRLYLPGTYMTSTHVIFFSPTSDPSSGASLRDFPHNHNRLSVFGVILYIVPQVICGIVSHAKRSYYQVMFSSPAKRRRLEIRSTIDDASSQHAESSPDKGTPSGIQSFMLPPRRSPKKILFSDGRPQSAAPGPRREDDASPDEPELPPTPTQLGLDPPPAARPTGLLSSSPSARRSIRRHTSDVFQSSSLVFDNTAQLAGDDDRRQEEHKKKEKKKKKKVLPEPVLKKQRLRDQLSTQRQELKHHISELEGWLKAIDHDEKNDDERVTMDMEKFKNIVYVLYIYYYYLEEGESSLFPPDCHQKTDRTMMNLSLTHRCHR